MERRSEGASEREREREKERECKRARDKEQVRILSPCSSASLAMSALRVRICATRWDPPRRAGEGGRERDNNRERESQRERDRKRESKRASERASERAKERKNASKREGNRERERERERKSTRERERARCGTCCIQQYPLSRGYCAHFSYTFTTIMHVHLSSHETLSGIGDCNQSSVPAVSH